MWGKNDRGQMGVGTGIGIDMVESENVPVQITPTDSNNKSHTVKSFHAGQNTMLIQDEEGNIYKTGLRLDYSPKHLTFFQEFDKNDVQELSCGRKHYVILNKHNQMMVWGNVFKDKP